MVLVDTSVWVSHLRSGEGCLKNLLEEVRVSVHPYVIEELACGQLKKRREILFFLNALPAVPVLSHEEILKFIDRRSLHGSGIGLVDTHLLGSACLSGIPLWTMDRRLKIVAEKLNVSFTPFPT